MSANNMHPWHYYITSIEATDDENLAFAQYQTDSQGTWGLSFAGTYEFDIEGNLVSH
jgi:hypothetical protein